MDITIASASMLPDGRLAILIDAGEATAFFNYLQSKKVPCTVPGPVLYRPRRIIREDNGNLKIIEEETLVSEIFAKGTREEFDAWLNDWIKLRAAPRTA